MDRKNFIKKSVTSVAGVVVTGSILKASEPTPLISTYDKLMDQVGFNHLPNTEIKTMKTVLHKADTRGLADHGWLKSNHSFSFANYYNPDRMNFGVLRVLNDDQVAAGKGFNTHPHDNMEIISIPLSGDLEHKDSMGNIATIKQGEIQVMSAGTGVSHSEYNKNADQEVKFLQIWVFPNKRNVKPRYDQIAIPNESSAGLNQILSPNSDDAGVWIHQNAWFHMGKIEQGCEEVYKIKAAQNGVYAFVLEGKVTIAGQKLSRRDGFGIWDTDSINITADSDARILLMEVPMGV